MKIIEDDIEDIRWRMSNRNLSIRYFSETIRACDYYKFSCSEIIEDPNDPKVENDFSDTVGITDFWSMMQYFWWLEQRKKKEIYDEIQDFIGYQQPYLLKPKVWEWEAEKLVEDLPEEVEEIGLVQQCIISSFLNQEKVTDEIERTEGFLLNLKPYRRYLISDDDLEQDKVWFAGEQNLNDYITIIKILKKKRNSKKIKAHGICFKKWTNYLPGEARDDN
jgi:hypothetical protein